MYWEKKREKLQCRDFAPGPEDVLGPEAVPASEMPSRSGGGHGILRFLFWVSIR